jgi:hypothetical protein
VIVLLLSAAPPLWAAEPAPGSAVRASQPADRDKEKGPKKSESASEFFARGPLPHLRIEIAPPDLDKLRQNPRAYVPATVRETGRNGASDTVYEKVGVHLKGGAGSFRSVDDRPGLTLNFKLYAPEQTFHGLERFHLNNSVQDGTYMSENLGNALFRDAGVPAARVSYARAWINGRELGVMVLKEAFSDGFLKYFFDDPRGTLYEGPFCADIDAGVAERVNPQNKKPEKVKELIAASNEREPAARRRRLAAVLDVDKFLAFMAVESFTAHWDGYCSQCNNYRIYHDPKSDRLVFLPHGTDQLFSQSGFPLLLGRGMVARAVTEDVEDRFRYLDKVAELRQKVFTPDNLARRLDEVSQRLAPLMAEVGAEAARQQKEQTESLRQRLLERVKNVDQQLAQTPRPLKFADGVATLAAAPWSPQQGGGRAKVDRLQDGSKSMLHIRNEGGSECTASFRTTVLLTKGHYVLEVPCRTARVTAQEGPNTGAGVRISGSQRSQRLTGDTSWTPATFDIDVNEGSREVVLVCELRATLGEAWFDLGGMKLRRK